MTRPSRRRLREDALAIWQAGVDAVRSDRLVRERVHVDGRWLILEDLRIDLDAIDHLEVVGAGKAGAGMAAGLEEALGERLMREKSLSGWVNVPADCVAPLQRITLHAARPAGANEPRPEGVAGAEEILRRVARLGPRDLCLCLISGGGSALLPAPIEGVSLEDKQAVTRHLSAAGANIQELNTVRKRLSRIKGGGLARACRAPRLIALVLSDVLGNPLDIIASGPTVPDPATNAEALRILESFGARQAGVSPSVFAALSKPDSASGPPSCEVTNLIVGDITVAVDAAGAEAERRGYSHAMTCADRPEGQAEDVGRHLAEMALSMLRQDGPDCLITGGEPVVRLVDAPRRGKGGRNQQLVLAALERLSRSNPALEGIALLSGGTDGEDGPTDAAGAVIDAELVARMRQQSLEPGDCLRRNDAYHFFEPLGGLIKTGPTHSNVCDVRVVVVERRRLE